MFSVPAVAPEQSPAQIGTRQPPIAARCRFRYGGAMAIFALALAVRHFALPVDGNYAFLTFYPGAALVAVSCGLGPAVVFVVLAALAGIGIFVPPYWDIRFSSAENEAMAMFLLSTGSLVAIVARFQRKMRRQNEALRATGERLARLVDELRLAKSDAEGANKDKSRFLAAASHDLRQPLSAMSLYVGALEGQVAPRGEIIGNMKGCIAHLNELLSDLLDISKLEAKVIEPAVRDFKVSEVLAKITASHGPQAAAKGLALRYRDTDAVGRTDPVLFQRIVGNLVSNAIRYSDRGGVLLACRQRSGKTWIDVWDTGIGIPADKTTAIFEEFIQLGSDECRPVKGSGLGLAIVAKTAELLNLQVRMRSEVGRGSVFSVEMPRGAAPGAALQRRHVRAPLRIALVEDDPDVALALRYALQHDGHEVIAAVDGDELMERLVAAPDIVVTDYRLAGKETGLGVIRRARARFGAALPAIVLTGDTDPALTGRVRAQAVRLAHKPLDIEALRALLAETRFHLAA